MPQVRIEGIRACVFDAYGTLFDFNAAAARAVDALGEKAGALSALWRDKQLQYTWLRALMGRHEDFWRVTGDALDFALESLGIEDRALRDRLLDAYLSLDTFPEVPDVLRRLKEGGLVTAILSNGSPKMLRAAVDNSGIAEVLDHCFSVEDVGIYKPDPRVYGLAAERLGLAPEEICFQSSNSWDAHGARTFGFRVVWCNRYGQRRERLPGVPDAEVSTLADLPAILGL